MTIPNWKIKSEYDFITKEEIGVEGVAWEFLRRNAQYASDFSKVYDKTKTLEQKWPDLKVVKLDNLFGTKIGFPVPDMNNNETQAEWEKRCKNDSTQSRQRNTSASVAPERWSSGERTARGRNT